MKSYGARPFLGGSYSRQWPARPLRLQYSFWLRLPQLAHGPGFRSWIPLGLPADIVTNIPVSDGEQSTITLPTPSHGVLPALVAGRTATDSGT